VAARPECPVLRRGAGAASVHLGFGLWAGPLPLVGFRTRSYPSLRAYGPPIAAPASKEPIMSSKKNRSHRDIHAEIISQLIAAIEGDPGHFELP